MSWAACASAPSHHFHAMPPRIIRNSDRPRASDRTMITTQTALALAKSLRLDWHCRHRQGNQTKGKPSRAKSLSKSGDARTDSGLDIETQVLSSSGRGRSFFLTSLFIELIELLWTLSEKLTASPLVLQLLQLSSREVRPDALRALLFQFQLSFLVSHEYTHDVHQHCERDKSGMAGVWTEFVESEIAGGMESQA